MSFTVYHIAKRKSVEKYEVLQNIFKISTVKLRPWVAGVFLDRERREFSVADGRRTKFGREATERERRSRKRSRRMKSDEGLF